MRPSTSAADLASTAAEPDARIGRSSLHPKIHRGTSEPPSVALLRHVLNPSVIVLSLLLSLLAFGQALTPSYMALAVLAFLVATQVCSAPETDCTVRTGWAELFRHRIFSEWLLVSALLMVVAFAFKVTDVYSRRVILTWFAITPFMVLAAQAGLRRFAAFVALRGGIQRSHVIVGANQAALHLVRRLEANPHLGAFRGFFDDRSATRLPRLPQEQLLGSMADVANYVRLNAVSHIYICLPMRRDERTSRLLEELKDTTASVYFVPDIFMFELMQARVCEVDGVPMVAVCETPFAGLNGVVKRLTDVVLASLALAVLWPVLLLVALAVRFSSPGPILFRQRRYGLYGECIYVYKFRSMTVCEDGTKVVQATRNDPRVTPIGGFLRRTSLDELPQLFNVLFGSMSMVGPRPHAVSHNEAYRGLIDGYMLRHKVRPGITGWAQVNGHRGETDTVEKMQRRVEYDLDYLRHWSLGLDLTILVRTATLVLRDRNAF